jgi:hypothetical protein
MLTDAYERLRHDATGRSGYGSSLRGLAILLREGMVAWMHACATVVAAPAALSPPRPGIAVPVCPNVQREVIDVLATMALTTALEGTT